jgi:hypothetical protein
MERIEFSRAFYIKLGVGGKLEGSSIKENKARIGWAFLHLEEINGRDWEAIKKKHKGEWANKAAEAKDINALKLIVDSTSDVIWITFHASQLWWCRFGESGIKEDSVSKFRLLAGKWSNLDINGHPLLVNQIPGNISKTQGFHGVVCEVKEVDDLKRLLNNNPSEEYELISSAKEELGNQIKSGLRRLYWKDFEILVDLLFHNAGWRRISLVGETMKDVDMELEEPITTFLYQVQVKAQATVEEFEYCAEKFENSVVNFSHGKIKKLYFIVHSPDKKLEEYNLEKYKDVELILPDKLASMVVEFGLTDWLLKKIK